MTTDKTAIGVGAFEILENLSKIWQFIGDKSQTRTANARISSDERRITIILSIFCH